MRVEWDMNERNVGEQINDQYNLFIKDKSGRIHPVNKY